MPRSLQTSILTLLLSSVISRDVLDLYDSLNWSEAIALYEPLDCSYPEYYLGQDFHGIEKGYLNPIAPITYDFMTSIATPPHERRIRHRMLDGIQGEPRDILDVGCGTGTGTLMLHQRYPNARIIGLDLSPYMLVMANWKAQKAGVESIQWQRGCAETMIFDAHSFDLVTISMVFHETPIDIAEQILAECNRILKPRGQLLILDGHQQKLRHLKPLTQLFREPYSFAYAQADLEESLRQARFQHIATQPVGWINQLTTAMKSPL